MPYSMSVMQGDGTLRVSNVLGENTTITEDLSNVYVGLWHVTCTIWTASAGVTDSATVTFRINYTDPGDNTTNQSYLGYNVGMGQPASSVTVLVPYKGANATFEMSWTITDIVDAPKYGFEMNMIHYGGTRV